MKPQDINSIFGIAPSTLSDWNKEDNKKNALAKLLKNITLDDALDIINQKNISVQKPMMLLSTVNCSIGNKEKHFTLTGLKKLFYKKDDLSIYDKYAIKTIKNEALQEEIEEFANYYKISLNRINEVLAA